MELKFLMVNSILNLVKLVRFFGFSLFCLGLHVRATGATTNRRWGTKIQATWRGRMEVESRLGCLDGTTVAGRAMGLAFLPLGGGRLARFEQHGVTSGQGQAKGLACRVAGSLGRTRCAECGGFLKVWILPRRAFEF